MLYRACVQRCTYVRIKGTQCIPSHASNAQRNMWARPATGGHNKISKICCEHRNWCQKKHKKEILKTSKKNDGIAFHYHETGQVIHLEKTHRRILEDKHTGKG